MNSSGISSTSFNLLLLRSISEIESKILSSSKYPDCVIKCVKQPVISVGKDIAGGGNNDEEVAEESDGSDLLNDVEHFFETS